GPTGHPTPRSINTPLQDESRFLPFGLKSSLCLDKLTALDDSGCDDIDIVKTEEVTGSGLETVTDKISPLESDLGRSKSLPQRLEKLPKDFLVEVEEFTVLRVTLLKTQGQRIHQVESFNPVFGF
nr:hypothetical protein [Tanacetum cinerariifolium]